MEPKIGRIVHFRVPEDTKPKVNFAETLPAIVVRVWSNGVVNLKVITDGPSDLWITSVLQGDKEGQWTWPVKEE
jgi:hypothetical protein